MPDNATDDLTRELAALRAEARALRDEVRALRDEVQASRDERDIQRLVLSYGPRVDAAGSDEGAAALARMWVEDGEYDIGGVGPRSGRADIAATFRMRHYANVVAGIAHVMGAPIVRVDGDTAWAFNYSCVFRPDADATTTDDRFYPWRISVNEWQLRRTGEGWRVVRRANRLMDGDPEALTMIATAARRLETG